MPIFRLPTKSSMKHVIRSGKMNIKENKIFDSICRIICEDMRLIKIDTIPNLYDFYHEFLDFFILSSPKTKNFSQKVIIIMDTINEI